MGSRAIETWGTEEVGALLARLEMSDNVVQEFKANSVQGKDLCELSDEDLMNDLKMTKLQVRKLRRELEAVKQGSAESAHKVERDSTVAQAAATPAGYSPPMPAGYPPAMPAGYPPATPAGYPPAAPAGYALYESAPQTDMPQTAAHASHTAPQEYWGQPAASAPYGTPYGYTPQVAAPSSAPWPHGYAPPAATPAGKRSVIRPEDANHWKALGRTIDEYERKNAELALQDSTAKLKNVESRAQAEKARLHELEQKLAKAAKEKHKVEEDKWYPGKHLTSHKKQEERASEKLKEYEKISAEVNAHKLKLDGLRSDAASAKAVLGQAQADLQALQRAREERSMLVIKLFKGQGTHASDATEDALESELDSYAPKLAEVKMTKQTYSMAAMELDMAVKGIEKATQMTQQAYGRANADLVLGLGPTNGPLGAANDIQKRRALQDANNTYQMAIQNMARAKMHIPDLPNVSEATIHQPPVFGDLIFDNIISDMIVRKQIQKSLAMMQKTQAEAKEALGWLNGKISSTVDPELHRLEAMYESKSNELEAYRAKLLSAAATT